MKELTQNTKKTLFSAALLLMSFHSTLVYADRTSLSFSEHFAAITKIYQVGNNSQQKNNPSTHLPEDAFLCNGKVVIGPRIIREQLSCVEYSSKSTHFVKL